MYQGMETFWNHVQNQYHLCHPDIRLVSRMAPVLGSGRLSSETLILRGWWWGNPISQTGRHSLTLATELPPRQSSTRWCRRPGPLCPAILSRPGARGCRSRDRSAGWCTGTLQAGGPWRSGLEGSESGWELLAPCWSTPKREDLGGISGFLLWVRLNSQVGLSPASWQMSFLSLWAAVNQSLLI